tara:strand:+ start:8312 stop:9025 length:714 start_codon:yes stop_codon:yes gene_type:complete
MEFQKIKINVPLWGLFLAFLISLIAISALAFWKGDDPKFIALIGGLLSGLLVFSLQFLLQIIALHRLDRFEQMGVIDLLNSRHDKEYYRPIVRGAKNEVKVMGASCTRFISDFMDTKSSDRALIDALRENDTLTVQILIPTTSRMIGTDPQRWEAEKAKIARVVREFNGRVEVRRFDDVVRHSFVLADNDLVAGPILPGDDSRNTPAVHVRTDTALGQKYRRYFERVWKGSDVESFA